MDVRKKTLNELVNNLKKYGRSSLVRSTGFGKTYMLTNLIKKYKKVLFLYPAKVIKNTVIKKYCEDKGVEPDFNCNQLEHITFMTYMKLIRLTNEEIEKMDYDLVIFDECHRIGANLTKKAVQLLFDKLPKSTHFVGSTATPNRKDAFDIIDTYFDNINVSEYTLHDSFKDGLLKKPYYVYFSYDTEEQVEKDLKEELETANISLSLKEQGFLKKKAIEIANLYNIEYAIEQGIKQSIEDTSSMKFICFFNNEEHVEDKASEVVGWFRKAFPNHNIETLKITSKIKDRSKAVDKLESLVKKENTIYLIFCIDMLNMGYHVSDITGIIMYRCTQSSIVYIQQLGRALSSGSFSSCVVFDIVDNIRRGSLFEMYDKGTIDQKINRQLQKQKLSEARKILENGTPEEIAKLKEDLKNTDYFINYDENDIQHKWWKQANDIHPEDLYGVGIGASYRRLINKVVAETMLQRCKLAYISHFRYWCDENNIPFPISFESLKIIYGYSKEDFNKYLYNLIKNNGFNYPLGDANLLKKWGMDVISKIWELTTEKVLQYLGV